MASFPENCPGTDEVLKRPLTNAERARRYRVKHFSSKASPRVETPPPLTPAERAHRFRDRQRQLKPQQPQPPPLTPAERVRRFRERQRQLKSGQISGDASMGDCVKPEDAINQENSVITNSDFSRNSKSTRSHTSANLSLSQVIAGKSLNGQNVQVNTASEASLSRISYTDSFELFEIIEIEETCIKSEPTSPVSSRPSSPALLSKPISDYESNSLCMTQPVHNTILTPTINIFESQISTGFSTCPAVDNKTEPKNFPSAPISNEETYHSSMMPTLQPAPSYREAPSNSSIVTSLSRHAKPCQKALLDNNDDKQSVRKMIRKIQNRKSARESRIRKAQHMKSLESKVEELSKENVEYKVRIQTLEEENANLKDVLAKLKGVLNRLLTEKKEQQ